jgi:hypothetical protein
MSRRFSSFFVAAVIANTGCASTPTAPPATPVDRAAAERSIATALDDFHDAAAHADEARYFAHFADDGVFLGTDATERWDVAAFRAYAHPRFASGKAWSFHATRRAISVSGDAHFAYFDEDLATERLGPARGSGVLVATGGGWKIEQYNLTVVIPNERFAGVRALLEAPAAPSVPPFADRYKAAYGRAVAAATAGDLAKSEHELTALVDEAESREGDPTGFRIHNAVTWVRWAQGDLVGALREIDAGKSALARAHLPAEDSARAGLHEKWDRAYILLEMALAAPPTLRASSLAAANDARTDYDRAATPLDDHDGLAVLAAFFAVRTKNAKEAVAAAKKVDVDKDGDLQDLYVVALAFDAAGDHARAESIRGRIRSGNEYLMKPLIVRQLDADAKAHAR